MHPGSFSRRALSRAIALAVLGAFPAGAALAAEVEGRVVDEAGRGLAAVSVTIADATVETGPGGGFVLSGIEPGTWQAEVHAADGRGTTQTITVPAAGLSGLGLTLTRSVELQDIEVRGRLGRLPGGLAKKRYAPNFIDAVTLDEYWRAPDEDVSEAAQRLPGVTVLGGEGRGFRNDFVSIRGLAAGLNNVTINGIDAPSSSASRAVALDGLASNMAGSIEIIKTVTPDMDANSIGGTININTLNAYDRADPLTLISGSIGQHSDDDTFTDEELPRRLSFLGTRRFGPEEQFGVALSVSNKLEHFSNAGGFPDDWAEVDGVFIPEGTRLEIGETERERTNVTARFDFRPVNSFSAYFEGHYTKTEDDQRDTQTEWNFAEDPEAAVASPVDDSGLRFFSAGGENEKEFDITHEEEEIYGFNGGLEFDAGSFIIAATGSYSKSELKERVDEWSFDTPNFESIIDLSGNLPWAEPLDSEAFNDPANFIFDEIDREPRDAEDELISGKFDLTVPLRFMTGDSFIKSGFKIRNREVENDNGEQQFEPPERNITLLDNDFLFNGARAFGLPISPTLDPIAGPAWDRANPDFLVFDPGGSTANSLTDDFSVEEDVLAGYLMGLLDIGAFDFIAGFRVEYTDTESNILEFIPGAPDINIDESNADQIVRPVAESNDYTEFLPNLQIRYEITPELQGRAAYTRTLARPELSDLAGSSVLDLDITSLPGGEEMIEAADLERGNPDLDPRISDNLDLALEWFPSYGGVISAGAFYKDIEDPIFIEQVRVFDVVEQGFEIPELDIETPLNSKSGEAYGFELIWDVPFAFLPGLWSGLGVSGNLVALDSEQDVPDRDDDLPLTQQPDLITNFTAYYSFGPFEFRALYNYTDKYLINIDRSREFDEFVDERFELDLHASYEFYRGWHAFVQADNVTEEKFKRFAGNKSRPTVRETVPTTWWFGIRGEF